MRLGRLIEGRARAPETPRRACQGGRRKAELRQGIAASPQARPLEARILIARILRKRDTLGVERGDEPRLGHVEQGTQHGNAGPATALRNRGKPVQPAATRQPHEHSLGLIVEMMGGDDCRDVMGVAVARHEIVARDPRCLPAGPRFAARPGSRSGWRGLARDARPCAPPPGLPRGPPGEGHGPRSAHSRAVLHLAHCANAQRDAAARRYRDRPRRRERGEDSSQADRAAPAPHPKREAAGGSSQQPALRRSLFASSRRRSSAVGKLVPSSLKAEQAASF